MSRRRQRLLKRLLKRTYNSILSQPSSPKKIVALTGSTGFVGGALIDRLIEAGYDVRALVRDINKLGDRRSKVEAVVGGLQNHDALDELARGAAYFVHCAGVTIARHDEDYHQVNVVGAESAARAAAKADARFIHISSMSAQRPEVSPYARSKFESESVVRHASGENPAIVLRGPAIYGPEDPVTLPFFKLVGSGVAAEPATKTPARASILYIDDMADAIVTVLTEGKSGEVFEVGDGRANGHEWQEIGAIAAEVLGVKARRFRAPRGLLEVYHFVLRSWARLTGQTPTVRSGQLNEFFHDDWSAKTNLLSEATSWRPKVDLREGMTKTIDWYRQQGWLKP